MPAVAPQSVSISGVLSHPPAASHVAAQVVCTKATQLGAGVAQGVRVSAPTGEHEVPSAQEGL